MWDACGYFPVAHILWSDDTSLADEIIALLPPDASKSLLSIAREALNKNYTRVAHHVTQKLQDYQVGVEDFLKVIELDTMDDLSGEPLQVSKVKGVRCDRLRSQRLITCAGNLD